MTNYSVIDIRPFRKARRYISIGSSIGKVLSMINNAMIRARAVRELQVLSDAQLEDIGIPRYAIRDVVNKKLNMSDSQRIYKATTPSIHNVVLVDERKKAA